ncbi:major facilitator superfamily domain-containing protein [Roridomyces roridus]|uniref:Major facilitator superfamily domain-containing protein n=1 Tax=Roridomyces roridus TaxID=1738132 RepID=A0AAD7BQV1_9AGAR|nr:major facilitator superfamily domain-containing protein [Roridomyces roridus]
MGFDLIRDSAVGQLINYLSGGHLLPYVDQRPGYTVSVRFLTVEKREEKERESASDAVTLCGDVCEKKTKDSEATTPTPPALDRELTLSSDVTAAMEIPDPYLVDWEENDSDNPRNWSSSKRAFVAFTISFLTFSVYIGSAIYTSCIPGLMQEFDVSLVHATLGLTLYVLGYGIGPMFFTPLQELPVLGRNPGYIVTLFLFVVCQIPLVTATNMNTVLAMRFLTGFFGSPALATGGASMGDIYPASQFPYVLGIWCLGATAGPILGPVIGGFAAQAESWRWPILELIWISVIALIFLALFLPETNGPTILLRRAQRLRKLTGNDELRTAGERGAAEESVKEIVYGALVMPLILSVEPALMFANVYLGFAYALFYLWFEAFPLVFTDIYHFNEGVTGLPFLGFLVSSTITYALYCLYQKYHINPRYARAEAAGKIVAPEIKLEIGLIGSIFIPTSVLIFGFASRTSVHWMVPVLGAALYLPGIFLIFQSILNYVTAAYPDHQAPVLAGNDLFRASIASVFPLFGRAFFHNMGLGPGSALLAGISVALMGVYWLLWKYAHILRRRSKYAMVSE